MENPYAFRLHFVGAGEGADERFLHQLEAMCSGQGFQLVSSHHHAHLSHSHNDLLDEIDRAFLGPGTDIELGETNAFTGTTPEACSVIGIGDVVTRHWQEGPRAKFAFLPRHMTVGFEFKPTHPSVLPLTLRLRNTATKNLETFNFKVPMPAT